MSRGPVLVGVGITPNIQLAEAAGLDVDNGILVDEHLRTCDPDIYAVGDVANAWHPVLRRRIRVEHWANALSQGPPRPASCSASDASYDRQPYFYSDQYDLGMEYTGYAEPGRLRRGGAPRRPPRGAFIAFWVAGGRVLAGMNVNVWDVTDDIKALVLSGRQIASDRLADPGIPLADL